MSRISSLLTLLVAFSSFAHLSHSASDCLANEVNCLFECIPDELVCNQVDDCPDGSDEKPDICLQCGSSNQKFVKYVQCDGSKDCENGYDEEDCDACSEGTVKCPTSNICIKDTSFCDGLVDCADGSDEINCTCVPGKFKCKKGLCIEDEQVCDGYKDCPFSEDEDKWLCRARCSKGKYQCLDGPCINQTLICDGHKDCPLGEDESADFCRQVGKCQPEVHYECHMSGTCIFKEWLCDGKVDCAHGEDEKECGEYICTDEQFKCPNELKCVDLTKKCDGHADCQDSFDELGCLYVQKSYLNSSWVYAQKGNQIYPLCDSADYQNEICTYIARSPRRKLNPELLRNWFTYIAHPTDYWQASQKNILGRIELNNVCLERMPLNCSLRQDCEPRIPEIGAFQFSNLTSLILLKKQDGTYCGGSLLEDFQVLTSAECVIHENPYQLTVYDFLNRTYRYVSESVNIHPNYDVLSGSHNLAIVNLAYSYQHHHYYNEKPSFSRTCLPDQIEELDYMACYTLGVVQSQFENGRENVENVRVKLLTQRECIEALNQTREHSYFPVLQHISYRQYICAEYFASNLGSTICQNSSGFPLVCQRQDGVWEQLGVSVHHRANHGCKVGLFTNLKGNYDFLFP